MTQNLAQDFIDLSNRSFGANRTAELHFNHGVNGFSVRPLVIVLHKDFPIEIIEMPHAMPQAVKWFIALAAFGVALERYEGNGVDSVDSMEIASARIGFVSRHFIDCECLGSCVYQFGKLWGIGSFSRASFYTGNDMGFNATHQMCFYPLHFASHLAPLVVKPSVIGVSGKSRRINCKVGFYGSKRACTLLNKRLEQWCQFGILQVTECAGKRWRLGNQFLSPCFSEVGHEASAGHCAVGLERKPEYDISQWQARSSEFILWLLYSIAEVAEQDNKTFLLMCLRFVIDRPVLSISDPHCFSHDLRSVWPFLFPLDKLDCIDVLALLVSGFKMLAGAKRLAIFEIYNISAISRLRRHFPAQLVLFNRVAFGYCQPSFLPFIHFITPYCIYNTIPSMVLSIVLGLVLRKTFVNFWIKRIDNAVPSMVYCYQMDDVQPLLADLKAKGWTNHSIADEIAVTVNSVEKWQAGDRNISRSHLILLNQLTKKKPPKKRRYAKGSRRQRKTSDGTQNQR